MLKSFALICGVGAMFFTAAVSQQMHWRSCTTPLEQIIAHHNAMTEATSQDSHATEASVLAALRRQFDSELLDSADYQFVAKILRTERMPSDTWIESIDCDASGSEGVEGRPCEVTLHICGNIPERFGVSNSSARATVYLRVPLGRRTKCVCPK